MRIYSGRLNVSISDGTQHSIDVSDIRAVSLERVLDYTSISVTLGSHVIYMTNLDHKSAKRLYADIVKAMDGREV